MQLEGERWKKMYYTKCPRVTILKKGKRDLTQKLQRKAFYTGAWESVSVSNTDSPKTRTPG